MLSLNIIISITILMAAMQMQSAVVYTINMAHIQNVSSTKRLHTKRLRNKTSPY
jgi:hypothetical protein